MKEIYAIIERADLPEPVKAASRETFRRIGEAEAQVHGVPVETIHFHEVGAIDSIADVIGAHFCMHLLGVDAIYASPLHVGSGTVVCAHGVMPVPAPATSLLLKGVPCYGGDVQGELVTPTGAALIAQWAQAFGPMPAMILETAGYGAGTKDIPGRPNVLRATLGQLAESAGVRESVDVIEANIDDMNPELFPPAMSALLAAGAKDAFITPIVGKKGRPGHLVTVLADAERTQRVAETLLAHTTTLGVRIRHEERIVLERAWREVATPWGPVRVKIGSLGGKTRSRAPEFEDCQRVAEAAHVPVLAVYEAALAAALEGDVQHA